jgi:selenocysteine-specific elongation factor
VSSELRVVATAGHVDHGKSSLIVRLTGIDPDRWAEEKRRGLTIDLGYAWCTLPSGREVGFVDVPGHERFIGNMLVGVGPVPLVLFVVAADEGWKPQSEEHLQILNVLGVRGGVVALTKRDLVDGESLERSAKHVLGHLAGSVLEGSPIVPVSSTTGQGLEGLVVAIDAMLDGAGRPDDARARLFVDRVFTIKGAGTVVTGTLAGGCLAAGDEVELYPTGARVRIRSLQTHKRTEAQACPIARVAVNLAGVDRERVSRGDVLARPAEWRTTRVFEARLRPIRNLAHSITPRGAFKLYTGATETDVRLRLYGTTRLEPGSEAFGRITTSTALVLDVGDRFVLREVGRRETVGGGVVLDVAPPPRPGPDAQVRLRERASASRESLPALVVRERGAILRAEAAAVTGSSTTAGRAIGGWFVDDRVLATVRSSIIAFLETFHRDHTLEPGADLALVRRVAIQALRSARAPSDPALADALLAGLTADAVIAREGSVVRLATHRISLDDRTPDIDRLLAAIGGEHEMTPPTVKQLLADGIERDVIDAAARAGLIVRIAPDLVVTPELVARAESVIRDAGDAGITVSALREALGTSRKYALPLLGWLDQRGVTRREGDLRFARGSS